MKIFTFFSVFMLSAVMISQNLRHNCTNTVTLQGSALTDDTQVLSSRPNNNFNYSVSNTVYSWTDGGADADKYILIKFDFPQDLLQSSTICEAKLSLYFNPTDPYEPFDFHYGTDNGFIISRITQTWNASTVTWNTKPSITNANEITLPGPSTNNQNYINIDVKTLVQAMVSGNARHGFQIRMKNPDPYRGLLFASSTNSNNALHPKLVLNYSTNVVAPPDCGVVINNFMDYNLSCDDEVTYRADLPGQISLEPGWTITQYKWTHVMSGGTTIVAYGSPSTVSMPCDLGFVDKSTLEVTASNNTQTCVRTKFKTLLSGGSQYINGSCCLNKSAINVYPNPVSDNLIISTNFSGYELQKGGLITLELYDIYGLRVIKSNHDIKESVNNLRVANLNNGIYFLKIIKNGEVIQTTRILKN